MSLFNRYQKLIVGLFGFGLHNVDVSSFPVKVKKETSCFFISQKKYNKNLLSNIKKETEFHPAKYHIESM